MGAGRGDRWSFPPWSLKLLSKKVVFSISSGKKQISPLLAPFWKKNWENPRMAPSWKKSFRHPWEQPE